MKISRSLLIWAILALCGVMVLGAMTWLTRSVLAAEKERTEAEARADLEERTRLALWRMDAFGGSILLRENRHPPADYYQLADGFPEGNSPEVFLHFSVSKAWPLCSPEIYREELEQGVHTSGSVALEGRLTRLRELLKANPLQGEELRLLRDAAEKSESRWQSVLQGADDSLWQQASNVAQRQSKAADELRQDPVYQANSSGGEKLQRTKALAQSIENAIPQSGNTGKPGNIQANATGHNVAQSPQIGVGQLRPVWLAGELFLLRQSVTEISDPASADPFAPPQAARVKSVEGVWMNLTELQKLLLHEAADLLPDAKLIPVEGEVTSQDPLMLVSFPFRLQRNETLPPVEAPFNSALIAGWIAVALALLTVSLLVHGVMRLSERRASFVSAVTHELRTPLTTFRLYSDMLESGAVKPEKRGDYLRVLSREADRLSHLVENVLSFSKIERGSARSAVVETTAAGLLGPMRERLEARLATAGLVLEMEVSSDPPIRVDAAAVEHILFNLIDNAAKYAAAGEPRQVEIQTKSNGLVLEIIVSDHGPGIPAAERRRIFRAFHKSAREAAESRPGVGLGLALSRRLAKSLGGGLDCVDVDQGARFVLRLPRT